MPRLSQPLPTFDPRGVGNVLICPSSLDLVVGVVAAVLAVAIRLLVVVLFLLREGSQAKVQ